MCPTVGRFLRAGLSSPRSTVRLVTPDLFESFSRAVVAIEFADGAWVLQPRELGVTDGNFPFDEAVHIVTAYNPGGLVGNETENRARHRLLARRTIDLGLETLPRVGSAQDGSIPEPGLLIQGVDRAAALALGRNFEQSAIYEWTEDSLAVIGVYDNTERPMGWRIVARANWIPRET
jgi:hypothetical protein